MSLTSKEHRAELERFNELLSKEAYQTQLLKADGGLAYDALLVRIETFEEVNRVWSLEISFLPGLEDELESVSLLQCYVALSDQITEEFTPSLARLIVMLNANLPIGGFGLLDNPRVLFFKHNAMLPDDNLEAGCLILHELVPLITYLITGFSGSLLGVATGRQSVEEAKASLASSTRVGE
jgi:hypothetical protein